jgi:hypothetical protein
MLYIALILVTILAIFFAVAHEEQKLKTEKYRKLSNKYFNELYKKNHEGTLAAKLADELPFAPF